MLGWIFKPIPLCREPWKSVQGDMFPLLHQVVFTVVRHLWLLIREPEPNMMWELETIRGQQLRYPITSLFPLEQ